MADLCYICGERIDYYGSKYKLKKRFFSEIPTTVSVNLCYDCSNKVYDYIEGEKENVEHKKEN